MTSPRIEHHETMTYVVGYGLAVSLTLYLRLLGGRQALYSVLGLGLAQMLVHFRCFLRIDLKRSARADLMVLRFSSLIVALMVGGTMVIRAQPAETDDVAVHVHPQRHRKRRARLA